MSPRSTIDPSDLVEGAAAKIYAGAPLSEDEGMLVYLLLKGTLRGEDPRALLGVEPRRGAPEKEHLVYLALHYWHLRLTEPKELDAVARKLIAPLWGVSESQVYQIALKYKREAQDMISNGNPTSRDRLLKLIGNVAEAAKKFSASSKAVANTPPRLRQLSAK